MMALQKFRRRGWGCAFLLNGIKKFNFQEIRDNRNDQEWKRKTISSGVGLANKDCFATPNGIAKRLHVLFVSIESRGWTEPPGH